VNVFTSTSCLLRPSYISQLSRIPVRCSSEILAKTGGTMSGGGRTTFTAAVQMNSGTQRWRSDHNQMGSVPRDETAEVHLGREPPLTRN